MSEPEKSEEQILFPDEVVEGITLRPWSYGKLCEMAPIFYEARKTMKKENLSLSDVFKVDGVSQIQDLLQGGSDVDIEKMIDLGGVFDFVILILPHSREIIARTIGLPSSEIEAWDLKKGTLIFLKIISQNLEHVKNLFGLRTAKKVESPPAVA
jgi:hypothetical protein